MTDDYISSVSVNPEDPSKVFSVEGRIGAKAFSDRVDLGQPSYEARLVNHCLADWAGREKVVRVYNDPTSINIDTTSSCNMKCWFCPYHGENKDAKFTPGRMMHDDLLARVLKAFPNTSSIAFGSLGEPLLDKRLPAHLRYIQENAPWVRTAVWSNGLLLDRFDLDELFGVPTLQEFNISIDTLSPEEHAKWSNQKGSLDKVFQNLARALEWRRTRKRKDLRLIVSFVIRRSELDQMGRIIDRMQEFDIDYLGFQNFIPDSGFPDETTISSDHEARAIIEETAKMTSRFDVGLVHPINLLERRQFCRQPFDKISISPEGYLSPCCNVARNADFGTFEGNQSFNGQCFTDAREKMHAGSFPFTKCTLCWANQDPATRVRIPAQAARVGEAGIVSSCSD